MNYRTCALYSRVRASLSTLDSYQSWWWSILTSHGSVMVVAHPPYFIIKENRTIKCTKCYTSLSIHEKENYSIIGYCDITSSVTPSDLRLPSCSLILIILRAVTGCFECPEILERFLVGRNGEATVQPEQFRVDHNRYI